MHEKNQSQNEQPAYCLQYLKNNKDFKINTISQLKEIIYKSM